MSPLLRDGQLALTVRLRRKSLPDRGAVVAVDSRELGCRVIKRIVGLPGEHLRIDGRGVFVNGRRLAEPYATSSSAYRGSFHVPGHHYLLLGDNRDESSDSRCWRHPYVARTEIVGRLLTKPAATERQPHRK
jgi:signal peptidase I